MAGAAVLDQRQRDLFGGAEPLPGRGDHPELALFRPPADDAAVGVVAAAAVRWPALDYGIVISEPEELSTDGLGCRPPAFGGLDAVIGRDHAGVFEGRFPGDLVSQRPD